MFCRKMVPVVLPLFFYPFTVFASLENETPPARGYEQKVEVSGRFEVRAGVEILPLYQGAKWALTSRWDDNSTDADATMAKVLEKYGYKGTFYLNWSGIGEALERSLIRRGHAMGSHSINHPGLTECTYNKILEELLKSRIDIETRTDFSVNSFAFPGNSFSDASRPEIQWDIYRLIVRAGYVQVAWSATLPEMMKDISGDLELPGDGHPLEPWFSEVAGNEALRQREPNMSFCTHAWAYASGNKWSLLESQLKTYAGKKDYWYCTQADYGAYRYQYRRSRIKNVFRTAKGLSFILVRPALVDAGRNVPLTLKVTGSDLTRSDITVDGKKLSADRRSSDTAIISVPFPAGEKLPEKIDAVYVEAGPVVSKKFPFLSAALGLEDEEKNLRLTLTNSGSPITNVKVTYRLPFAAAPGMAGREVAEIAKDKLLADTVNLTWPDRSLRLLDGRGMFAAQVDFKHESRQNRLYVVRYKAMKPSDSTKNYPQGNFAVLGPIPEEEATNGDLFGKIAAHPTASFTLAGGKTFSWQPIPIGAGITSDYVGAAASSFASCLINSPEKQEVIIKCPGQWRIWLNSKTIESDRRVILEKGDNWVLVMAKGGFWWQVISPKTGKRIGNLTYTAPKADPKQNVTVVPNRPYRFFIKSWLVCGPFPNPGLRPVKKGFDVDYLTGQGGEARVRPEKDMEAVWDGQKFKWLEFTSPQPKMNLFEFPPIKKLTNKDDILVYACCYLQASRDINVLIGLGSDDGYKLYLNHKLIKTTRAFRGSSPDQEVVPARLKKGLNILLLKVDQDFGEYDFLVSLNSPDFGFLDVKPVLSGK